METSLENTFSKLIISLLDNYSVSDDTLLSKLLTALENFYTNSGYTHNLLLIN